MPKPTDADFLRAVQLRSHHGPCVQPGFPCLCGADTERALIAQALADQRADLTARCADTELTLEMVRAAVREHGEDTVPMIELSVLREILGEAA
jgi:hypothetical protein